MFDHDFLLRLRSEFDARSPKMRLSLITYLLEGKVQPEPQSIDAYVNMVDRIMEWVGSQQAAFFDALEASISTDSTSESQTTIDTEPMASTRSRIEGYL